MRVVLATANPDKAAEIVVMLEDAGFEVAPRPSELPDVVEDAHTLEGNARLKALAVTGATGEISVGDDTGLEVRSLGGAPGVYSARYAGEGATYADNVNRVLAELDGVGDRSARFRTAAVACFPDGTEVMAEGWVDGIILEAPRGDGGFGYDSVFVPDEGGNRTFAEMTREEKQTLSHRGRAFRALAAQLQALST